MKLVINAPGEFVVKASEKLCPTEQEVVFQVKACGICGSDLPRAFDGTAYYYPCVMGHEFSGIVRDAKDSLLIGMRAVVFPILPCGECEYCAKEAYANCAHYDYYGSRRDGGMQDELLVKKENLILLPDLLSFEEGAFVEPMAVTLHAVKIAGITPGCTVNVFGAGTIGILCGLWAKVYGAKTVRFCDIDQAKLDFAVSLGFEIFEGQTADVCMEASGAGAALDNAIQTAAAFGKVVLVGNAHKDMVLSVKTYSQILRKQLAIAGSWNSSFSSTENDWKDSINALADGKINVKPLITHRFSLEQGAQAFELARDASVFKNKIMFVMNGSDFSGGLSEFAPLIGAALSVNRKRRPLLSASIMCADPLNLGKSLEEIKDAGIPYIHCDIMDNHFVPNLMLPMELLNKLHEHTELPYDYHIMAEHPESIIDKLSIKPGDMISVHMESTPHLQLMLTKIKSKGAKAAVAINPATPIESLTEVLHEIQMVLLMSVNPGFSGQKIVPGSFDKIKRLRKLLDEQGYTNIMIEVDGNCSFENVPKMYRAGAEVFVVGTSSVFNKDISIKEATEKLYRQVLLHG